MATKTTPMSELALKGGAPFRAPDDPLPTSVPRPVAPEASRYVNKVLDSKFAYDMVGEFERTFAETMGVKHAVAMSTCTNIFHGLLAAKKIGPGDEVIASPITDYGTVKGIIALGAKAVFPDVDVRSGLVTAEEIEKVITPRTKAIIAVHMYGLVCDMDPIVDLARNRKLLLIEDVCQAPMAEYKGRLAGTIAEVGCFSFDGGKHLSNAGAMAITNDGELAEEIRFVGINRGARPAERGTRVHEVFGHAFHLSRLEAAVGMANLPGLRAIVQRRNELADRLSEKVRSIDGVSPPYVPAGCGHAYWLYYLNFDLTRFSANIGEIIDALNAEGLKCGPAMYYLIPYSHTFLQDREEDLQRLKNARAHLAGIVRWPWSEHYTDDDIDDVAEIVAKVADAYQA